MQELKNNLKRRKIVLKDFTFEMQTPKSTVVATSLDGKPLRASDRVLITVVGRANSLSGSHEIRSEPQQGLFRYRRSAPMHMRRLGPNGQSGPFLTGENRDGAQTFTFPDRAQSHWYLLEPVSQSR